MKRVFAILYLLCASLISLWCVVKSIAPPLPEFATIPRPEQVELLFVGDVMVHEPQLPVAQRANGYDFNSYFKYVKPQFDATDCVIANLETTLSTTPPYRGYPCFKSPAELADALAAAGVDIAVTANNHCLDSGKSGVESTLEILRNRGITPIGTTPEAAVRFTIKGIDFALLAYTYGTNGIPTPDGVTVHGIDTLQMRRDIESCADADCRIAFVHWGAEYTHRPDYQQRTIADFLHRAGCQVVIGSHPHTVHRAECSKRAVTVYSLGNFVSNQRRRYSDGGVMAKLVVEKDSVGCSYQLDIKPVWVHKRDGYAIVPQPIADTLKLNSEERAEADIFFDDTYKILTSQF